MIETRVIFDTHTIILHCTSLEENEIGPLSSDQVVKM